MKSTIENFIKQIISQVYDIDLAEVKLETPPKKEMGDFAFGCFVLSKDLRKSPADIAKLLHEEIEKRNEAIAGVQKVEAFGPYLNFFVANDSYNDAFAELMNRADIFQNILGSSDETIYIDYIGANVGKPLHIGHMCTPSHGQVFINLFTRLGYNVISDSHIGDWGIIFGKLIVAYKKYGDENRLHENAVEHLFELYVQISTDAEKDENLETSFREAFKLLSEGDSEMKSIWAGFTKYSIEAMNQQLSRISVTPKYNIGESFYEGLGLPKMEDYPDLEYSMKQIVEELIEKGIATKNDDGSVGVVFPDEMKIPSCILQKRDGTHGYLASDLASVKYRMTNWNPEKIIYFVDVRQQLHLRQTFVISKMAGWLADTTEITHAYNGFISLKDGAMSTRKGKIIKLEALLDEAEKRAANIITEKRSDISEDKLKELSKIIGIGAIKYGYLKKSRETDVVFDWDEFMSFEGNSGPYIQYAYVRAQKILEKYEGGVDYANLNFNTSEEKELLKHILNFEKTFKDIKSSYYAHSLCLYVYELTKKFSALYNNVAILSEENEEYKASRIALLQGFSKLIEESFAILGIPLPDEM